MAISGIGDNDAVLSGRFMKDDERHPAVGVLIEEFNRSAFTNAAVELRSLLEDSQTSLNCRTVAETLFDLERVGWMSYRNNYDSLLGIAEVANLSKIHETLLHSSSEANASGYPVWGPVHGSR